MDSDEEMSFSSSGSESDENELGFETTDRDDSDEYKYKVIFTDNILNDMNDTIVETDNLLGIGSTSTRILLNHFKWDEASLFNQYCDVGEKLFAQVGISTPSASNIVKANVFPDDHKETCPICFSDVLSSVMKSGDCGHRFCHDCWCEYLTQQIMVEGQGLNIPCPSHKCKCIIDDQTVISLVPDAPTREKFLYLTTNSLVECNSFFRWCPASDCKFAVKVEVVDARPVSCKCGHTFCFSCAENWHDTVNCNILKKWIKKCDNDDSETSNWIATNTKECPKCHVPIEKSEGCNHMICQTPSCKWHFCWVCMGPWEPHGYAWYNCNRFDEEDAKAARDAQEKSRADLQRFLFYFNRYQNHMQSLQIENKLYEKLEMFPSSDCVGKQALDTLRQCRQTLMYTYVFAYYVKKTNQSVIFEDNQRDLESRTEILSEYFERRYNFANSHQQEVQVQRLFRYCAERRKVLLDHVHEGYKKEWWEFNE